ncbi:MAG: PorV/PorQ family protein [Candidatus Kapabacteria bacterium]|nr:PorV/PorQ family protein [Candidatus Kapabacteria bacterium]
MQRKYLMKWLTAIMALTCIASTEMKAQAGGSAVPFLLISPDARASAMGDVGTAIADDINAVYWNPAGLGFHNYINPEAEFVEDLIPYRQVSLTYSKWLPQFNADLFYSTAGVAHYFEKLDGTLAFNFIFMNLGEFTKTDYNGNEIGKFISNEYSIGLSYGTQITDDLAIGFQLKYIVSNLAPKSATDGGDAGTGMSGGFDIGLLWRPSKLDIFGWDISNKLSLGFNLQNVGPKVTYRKEADPLPTNLRLGVAAQLYEDEFNDLKLSCDLSKTLVYRDSLGSDPIPTSLITGWKNKGVELGIGFEYWYKFNNLPLFALRGGYFAEPAKLGNRKYFTFGAGVKYNIFNIDMSFISPTEENHPLANTMRFSLLVDWK